MPPDNQVPMVLSNDDSSKGGDGSNKDTGDVVSDATNDSGVVASSNREHTTSNTDSTPSKRGIEESDFTRPQEELLFL